MEKTIADDAEIDSDFNDLFEDSGDESSFDGSSVDGDEDSDGSDDSDVNLEGLVNEGNQ